MQDSIPELSFIDIKNGNTIAVKLLNEALANHGFFSITDHGLSSELVEKCYELSRDFFNLDIEIKNSYSSVGSKGARDILRKELKQQLVKKYLIKKNFGIMDQILMRHLIRKSQKI